MEARMKGCLAALLGVALALGLVAGTCRMAQASGGGTTTEPVPYLAWSGTELVEKTGDDACKAYELVTKKTTTLEGGKWYVVSESVNNKYQITVTGDVNLILCDGAELTVSEGIRGGSNTISVYAQSEDDPGTLSVKGVHGSDSVTYGVPGGDGALAMEGNLVVYGGKIYVHGGDGGWGSSGIDEYSPDGSNGGNGGGGLKGDLTLYSGRASVSGGYLGLGGGQGIAIESFWDDELQELVEFEMPCGSEGSDGSRGFGIDGSVTVHNYAAFHNGRVDIEGGDGDSDVVCSGLTVGENLDVENEYGLTTDPYRLGCSELHVFPVRVRSITFNPSSAQVNADETVGLTATIEPDRVADKTVVWSVGGTDEGAVELFSDEECETPLELGAPTDVLTVYAKGVAAGTAAVIATSHADSTKSASCDVTVRSEQTIAADDVEATYGDAGKFVSATTDGDGAISYAVKAGSEDYIVVDAQTGALTIKRVGTAYVTVTAEVTATYAAASKDVAVTIGRADLSGAKVTLKKTSYVYNGKARKPGVRSVALGGRRLRAGTDYSVSYKNNAKAGTATVTVKGRGNYKGSAKATFQIAPTKVRGLSTADHPTRDTLDATWKAAAGATSYELSWRAVGGKWRSKSARGTRATVDGLEAGGLYEVRVRAKAGAATGAWSKPASRWLRKVSSLRAATGSARGSIEVSWDRDARATGGYEVWVCARKGGSAVAKKAVAADGTSATVKGLESGRAYHVKVRPLRKVSGTTYVGVMRYFKTTVKAK